MSPAQPNRTTVIRHVQLSLGHVDVLQDAMRVERIARHAHDTYCIGVVDDGAARLKCGRESYDATPGSIIVVRPEEAHAAELLTDRSWLHRVFYLSPSIMDAATEGMLPPDEQLHFAHSVVHGDPELEQALRGLHTSMLAQEDAMAYEERLLLVLRAFAHRHGSGKKDVEPERLGHAGVRTARDYLHARFTEPVSVATLAQISGISAFHLIREFGEAVGMPPHAYLKQLRIRRAHALLQRGVPATTVAYESGFADQAHLTRAYKSVFGITPGAYLRAVRKSAGADAA